jgi:hypothetical protein
MLYLFHRNKQGKPKMAKSTRTPLEQFFARSLTLARSRDKMKGWDCDENVTIKYLVGLFHGQQGLCCHTGEHMTIVRGLVEGAVVFDLCTMERIDNTKGYIVGNIMLACDGINRMRGDMELSQFRNFCKRIGLKA